MPLDPDDAVSIATKLLIMREDEQPRLKKIAAYLRNDSSSVYVPRGARQEYRWLIKRARLNILPLVVTVVAQSLYVDGYRPAKSDDDAPVWATWQANRMDGRQHGLHRAVLKYGVAYVTVLPGTPNPVITPKSPRRMTAFYADPVDDEWPMYAIEETIQNIAPGKQQRIINLYDEVARYRLTAPVQARSTFTLDPDGTAKHDLGVCPVVRYLNGDDLDGDASVRGEVEPLIEMQDQLNSTTFNLLMAQQYAAFRQRYATGMAVPLDPDTGSPVEPFNAAVNRLWVAEDPDTRFGEFNATDLSGYLNSREATIRHIATVSQTPPHNLLGQMVNLSAEALNAAESSSQRKIGERKSSFGEAHEQMLRLAALAGGDQDGWTDTSSQVVWRDTGSRSLAQTADALGKLVTMLGVPPEELWQLIPGITQQDVERWRVAAKQKDAIAQLNEIIGAQMKGGPADQSVPPDHAGGTMVAEAPAYS